MREVYETMGPPRVWIGHDERISREPTPASRVMNGRPRAQRHLMNWKSAGKYGEARIPSSGFCVVSVPNGARLFKRLFVTRGVEKKRCPR